MVTLPRQVTDQSSDHFRKALDDDFFTGTNLENAGERIRRLFLEVSSYPRSGADSESVHAVARFRT